MAIVWALERVELLLRIDSSILFIFAGDFKFVSSTQEDVILLLGDDPSTSSAGSLLRSLYSARVESSRGLYTYYYVGSRSRSSRVRTCVAEVLDDEMK